MHFLHILGADNDHRGRHVVAVGRGAVEFVVGIAAHIPTERPRTLIVIGDDNVAPTNRAFAQFVDLAQRALDVRRGMGIDQIFGGHVKVDIGNHVRKTDGQQQ